MPTDAPALLTAAEVARRFGVKGRTIRRWAESDMLPIAQRLPGDTGAYLFHPADVDALAASRAAERTEATA